MDDPEGEDTNCGGGDGFWAYGDEGDDVIWGKSNMNGEYIWGGDDNDEIHAGNTN